MGFVSKQIVNDLNILLSSQLYPGNCLLSPRDFALLQQFLDAGLDAHLLLAVNQIHHFIVLDEIEVLEQHQHFFFRKAQPLQAPLQLPE